MARWLAVVALLWGFGVASWHLTYESLWDDEGWSLYAVEPTGVADVLARVREDVHPPLYFLALDVWVLVAGESAYAVRLLSALFGTVALAATYALGRRLFDTPTGLSALLLLGSVGFFVHYAREVRMYSLLLLLSALATLAYWRWYRSGRGMLLYGAALAGLLYTHYAGVFIVLAHLLHRLVVCSLSAKCPHHKDGRGYDEGDNDGRGMPRPYGAAVVGTKIASSTMAENIVSILRPYLVAAILYLPWLPVLLEQIRAHDARPLALPVVTDWTAVGWLLGVVTGDFALPFVVIVVAGVWLGWQRQRAALSLLLLWLLLTPAGLLLWNAWLSPVYQVRYAIGILPAAALLAAWGLWGIFRLFNGRRRRRPYEWAAKGIFVVVIGWIVYAQLMNYGVYWKPKSRYNEAAAQMTAARQPDEPLIADLYWAGVMAYYDRLYGIRSGAVLDVTRTRQNIADVWAMAAALDGESSVWVVMPTNVPRTWATVAALLAGRGVGYRDTVMNMLFYRFDARSADALQFRFGDSARYDGTITGRYALRRGDPLCVAAPLTALTALDGALSASVQLLDADRTVLAGWDGALDGYNPGGAFTLSPCLDLPPDLPAGDAWLQLALYRTATFDRLPLIEADTLYWGDGLLFAHVEVE